MSTLALLPLGEVAREEVAAAGEAAAVRLGLAPVPLARREPPAGAYDPARGQWDALVVLRAVLDACPASADRVLAVTDRDLGLPVLTFVFGQAQLGGPAALVSTARLRTGPAGCPADPGLLAGRLRKEAVHELGHTLGLVHCADPSCVMALSVSVAGIDGKSEGFCAACGAAAAAGLERLRRPGGAAEV